MIPRLDVILRKYSLTFDFVDKFTSKSKKHDQRVVKQSERAQQKITKRLIIHLEGSKKSIKRTVVTFSNTVLFVLVSGTQACSPTKQY